MDAPRYSLIIPAWNEEKYLPRLLDSVDAARQCCTSGASAVEVIVADNGSTDSTARVAADRGCRVVRVEKRVIAAARNGGAAAARGEVLCFVDADMRIHRHTFNEIESTLASPRVVAGASGVRLERWSLGLAATWCAMMPMVMITKMDTGVVFCRRQDYLSVGGYNETRLYAEDVQFLWDLRRLGRSRGQSLARLRQSKALASTCKFDKHGDWHYFTQIFGLGLLMLRKPDTVTDFVRRYWYEDER